MQDQQPQLLFADEASPPLEASFRLARLDIYNWGPFRGLHRVDFDPEGTAIIGPTGSGKTTLVDALMTLLVSQPRYNLASTGGHESDRTLISYVRGVLSGDGSDGREEVARPGKTITGIGFQCRTAVFVKNDTVYLRYLPVEPESVQAITLSDVSHKSLSLTLTETEDLVTKMVVKWRPTYADDDERNIILRHNVQKYGVQEREFDWYIYNQPDIIRKAATFWLIRLANTWKKVRFKGYLNLLNIETFDGVTLDLPVIGPVLSLVDKATYNSADNEIEFECWTPIKAGTTHAYPFAWPYNQPGEFPASGDLAGSDFSVTGDLPVGSLQLSNDCPNAGGVIIGGPNIVFQGPADRGDPRPADIGFEAQSIIAPGTDFNLTVVPRPRPNLDMIYAPTYPVPDVPQIKQSFAIDIANTLVVDSNRPQTNTTLASILQFDPHSEAYAARRAFLAED